jgi:catechol 2,3-dioxygenase-like lactoylglutathione lyase family enzyme
MPSFVNAAATLPVSDMERARAFYEGKLGLTVQQEDPGGVNYAVGSSTIFVYPSEFAGTNQATAAGLEVTDLDGAMAEMRSAGVTFEEYDLPGMKTENGVVEMEGARGAWFKDPDGNILSLLERASS